MKPSMRKRFRWFLEDCALLVVYLFLSLLCFIPWRPSKYEWGRSAWKTFTEKCVGYYLMSLMNRH